ARERQDLGVVGVIILARDLDEPGERLVAAAEVGAAQLAGQTLFLRAGDGAGGDGTFGRQQIAVPPGAFDANPLPRAIAGAGGERAERPRLGPDGEVDQLGAVGRLAIGADRT